jgi:hypothetical protein
VFAETLDACYILISTVARSLELAKRRYGSGQNGRATEKRDQRGLRGRGEKSCLKYGLRFGVCCLGVERSVVGWVCELKRKVGGCC